MGGFADGLIADGFSESSIRRHLANLCHLNDFLANKGFSAEDCLREEVGHSFLEVLSKARTPSSLSPVKSSLRRFEGYLLDCGLERPSGAGCVYGALLEDYLEWLRTTRGLTDSTIKGRRCALRSFLEELGPLGSAEGMASLCRESVESFYLAWAEGKGNSCRRLMGQALRSLLRFCHERGLVKYPLDKAVPPFHAYSLAKPPQGLDEGQMKKVFAGVPTDSDVGRRDRAILLLLETYGVRAGQVQRLRLDDIHWRLDEILFRALKGGKDSRLPLTEEAGMALLDYLRLSRPKTSCPEVFLTMTPPFRPLHTSTGISCIVKRRMKAAGIDSPGLAAHGYRHGLATRCLNEGHSLKEIADLLGHRQLNSTFHYTKVDFLTLRPVALEWPEKGHS